MWAKLSHFILRQRVPLLIIILLLTGFMGWWASGHLELSYKYARVLPEDDEMAIAYEKFKAKYGEDGNVMLLTIDRYTATDGPIVSAATNYAAQACGVQ